MDFVKFKLDADYDDYSSQEASNIDMCLLGFFFSDLGCGSRAFQSPSFLEWALADKNSQNSCFANTLGTNSTILSDCEDGFIYVYDDTGNDPDGQACKPAKISREQFVKLLEDWRDKVCKTKPKKVIIKHEKGQFTIETSG